MTDDRRVGPCFAGCFQRELADPSGQLTQGAVDVTLHPVLGPLLAEPKVVVGRKPRSDAHDGPVRSRVRRPVALRTQGASYRSKPSRYPKYGVSVNAGKVGCFPTARTLRSG